MGKAVSLVCAMFLALGSDAVPSGEAGPDDRPLPPADHWSAVVVNGERIDASIVRAFCRPLIEDNGTSQLPDDERRCRVLLVYGNQWQDMIERTLVLQHLKNRSTNREDLARWRDTADLQWHNYMVLHGDMGPTQYQAQLQRRAGVSLGQVRRVYEGCWIVALYLYSRVDEFKTDGLEVTHDGNILRSDNAFEVDPYRELLYRERGVRCFIANLRRKATIEVIADEPVIEWSADNQESGVSLGFDHSER
jgi:hypothetical protein